MPSATVIDQLIVKLGLDPREFDKGQKAAARAVVETEKQVKRSSDNMSRSVVGFTGKLLGIATAAAAVRKVAGYVSDLSVDVRRLGIDSKNFGIAASEMRNFQNIGEMFGGKAEDVTKTIGGLTQAVYNLAYNGQISDSLVMLARMGVQFQDTAGNARDFKDIVLDTEKQVQSLMKAGTSRANANQMLMQAGFDPGLAQAMLSGNVADELAKQQQRVQVGTEHLTASDRWEKSAANRDQELAASSLRGLPAAAAAGAKANDLIAAGARAGGGATLDGVGKTLEEGAESVKQGVKNFTDALNDMFSMKNIFPKGRHYYEKTIQEAAKANNIDPELLAGVLSTESNFNPGAVNAKSGATGIAQLMPKYFPKAGENPHDDIRTAAEFLSKLQASFMADGNDLGASQYLALQAYNAGQTRVRRSMSGDGKPLAKETLDYPGKVLGYANSAQPTPNAQGGTSVNGGNTTDVSIGSMTINTQATDAEGVARGFADGVQRKLTAAQGDTGMQ